MDVAVDFELLGSKAKVAVIEAAPTTHACGKPCEAEDLLSSGLGKN